MNAAQYLNRIGFTGPINQDIYTLQKLQYRHLLAVPFEDIDIYYNHSIPFNKEYFFDKVVSGRRGGYCYELNSLFGDLLTQLGFDVQLISGRVANGKKYGPEFDHMALIVTIDAQQWLVDVGFGDFSMRPMLIGTGALQHDYRCNYRLRDIMVDGQSYISAEKWNNAKKAFVTEYIFTLTPRTFADFADMHQYQQTSPESHFVRNLMCSLPTAVGRVSIVNNRLIQTTYGIKTATRIPDTYIKQQLLMKHFKIGFTIPDYAEARA